jgi:plasmid stability protein
MDGTGRVCYCVTVRNITVSVPDDVYRRARIRAAERGTSVSALVRDHLQKMTSAETEFERLKQLQDEVIDSIHDFSAADRLSRDEVHDRDALRRLEYPAVRDQQRSR